MRIQKFGLYLRNLIIVATFFEFHLRFGIETSDVILQKKKKSDFLNQ